MFRETTENMVMSRRSILLALGTFSSFIVLSPHINKMRNSPANEFIIINGWVLRVDDIQRKL